MTDPSRVAALDQVLAALSECVDGFVEDVRSVLNDSNPGEVWLALSESLRSSQHPNVCDLCAGALVRLARQEQP